MAVTVVLSEIQRDTLRRLCDTFVPSIRRDDDPTGFWARSASDMGVPEAIEESLAQVPPDQLAGLRELLDGLAADGFDRAPSDECERMVHERSDSSPEALAGMSSFRNLALTLFYGMTEPETNRNPNWEVMGYPGPPSEPPTPRQAPKTIRTIVPPDGTLSLEADVCVVGSGSGGGVVAGTLAASGRQVAVLEMGGYYNESDFNQLELWAYEHLYHGGGYHPTADGQVTLMAGTSLGGGTTVNWSNCLRTPDWVREEWERQHGLEGVAGADYDRHLDAVLERIGATDACSDLNGPHQRLKEACERSGLPWKTIVRNADPERYDPATAGFGHFGDQSGAKLGTMKTYLQDAADCGSQFVTRCRVERVLTEGGRAAGVEGTYQDADGRAARVVVRAPQVVVAGGSLESPAILLRSGIGGPAAGAFLRLHPATAVAGYYEESQRGWWGPPQAGLTDRFADIEDGHGFLIESGPVNPGIGAASTPWETGRQHKEFMSEARFAAAFVFLIRDRGHGRVTIDRDGNAVHEYPLTDPLDVRIFRRGLTELARLHEAAGARRIVTYQRRLTQWDRGEDLDAFIEGLDACPLSPYEHAIFSAHQMGSCRMGKDRASSVAGPWGELHDTPGVWIGDASAFPSASGVNPMVSVMALAHRTAEAILAAD